MLIIYKKKFLAPTVECNTNTKGAGF